MGCQKRKKEGRRHTHTNTKHTRTRDATRNNVHECESSSLAVRPPDRTGSDRIRPDPDISKFGDFEDLIDRELFYCCALPALSFINFLQERRENYFAFLNVELESILM
jgi:hypothetical protein